MAKLLTDTEIDAELADLPEWNRDGDTLVRIIKAETFPAAIDLVDRVAVEAEARNHHPDMDIRWRTVTFSLTTHAMGGISPFDVGLAHAIDRIALG